MAEHGMGIKAIVLGCCGTFQSALSINMGNLG